MQIATNRGRRAPSGERFGHRDGQVSRAHELMGIGVRDLLLLGRSRRTARRLLGERPDPPAHGLEPLDRRAARLAPEPRRHGGGAQPRDLLRQALFLDEENVQSVQRIDDVQESHPGERAVPFRGRRRELSRHPAAELPAPRRRDPVKVAAGSSPRPQDPEEDESRSTEPGQRRVDLRVLGSPDGVELRAHGAFEVVSGAGLLGQQPEENVGERHAATIST
jgi:hypothetical protein